MRTWLALLMFVRLLNPGAVHAQSTLTIRPDVRAEGMGGAEVVLNPGPYAAWGNVGALGLFSGIGVAGTRFRLAPDWSDDIYFSFGSAALAVPLGGNRLVFDVHTAHVGYMAFSTQPYSPPAFHVHDDAQGIAMAVGIGRRLGVGIGVKAVRAGGDDPANYPEARSTAFDFGILCSLPWAPAHAAASYGPQTWDELRVGISASNLGAPLTLYDPAQARRMPHLVRLAMGETLHLGSTTDASLSAYPTGRSTDRVTIVASVAAEKLLNDPEGAPDSTMTRSYLDRHQITLRGGVEARLYSILALRAGYIHDDPGEIKNFTYGAGLSWHEWAGIDFASIPQYPELTRVTKFSAWFRLPFPAERPASRQSDEAPEK